MKSMKLTAAIAADRIRSRRRAVHGALLATATSLAVTTGHLHAQSGDALLDKLVEKGVLNVDEANDLRDQVDKDFTKAHAAKTGLPEWVTAFKINGDFRGRYEGFYSDNPSFVDRNRFRYRARLGFTASIADDFEVGLRLATGDDSGNAVDPISTNQTMQNNGSKKPINVDMAYAKWSPIHTPDWNGAFTFGKMENPFVLSDAVIDNDYTPEGAAQQFAYTINPEHALKLNTAEFVLDELGASSKDPYLVGAQLRWDAKWDSKWSSTAGVTYLSILGDESLSSANVPDINRGNSRVINAAGASTTTTTGFDTLVVDAGVTYTLSEMKFHTGPFPVRVFGEYLHNGAAESRNAGYQAGVQFGKAGKRKTWELTYRYKVLEGDVWYEELTDSDFGAYYPAKPAASSVARTAGIGYGSGTNVRGHVVRFAYSPYDSLTLYATVFLTELVDQELVIPAGASGSTDMTRLQVDAVWKF